MMNNSDAVRNVQRSAIHKKHFETQPMAMPLFGAALNQASEEVNSSTGASGKNWSASYWTLLNCRRPCKI